MRYNKAFTLTELSIVLVIIALLIAGSLGATSAIKNIKLRALITEMEEYQSAISLFEDRFNYLPGDVTNATSFWPNSNTANGDGDWQVEVAGSEDELLPQHLSLANLVEESYTGAGAKSPGDNIPVSKAIDNAGFWFRYGPASNGIYNKLDHSIDFGGWDGTDYNNGALSVDEAYAIENKNDDGDPDAGRIYITRGLDQGSNICTDNVWTSTSATSFVLTDNTERACRLHLWYDLRK